VPEHVAVGARLGVARQVTAGDHLGQLGLLLRRRVIAVPVATVNATR